MDFKFFFIQLLFSPILTSTADHPNWFTKFGDMDNPNIEWECLKMNRSEQSCVAIESHHHFPLKRPQPLDITITDRINSAGWRYLAELWVPHSAGSRLVEHEYFRDPLECYISCLKPLTVVHVLTIASEHFFKNIVPLLKVPIILLTTDYDDSNPRYINMNDNTSVGYYRAKIPAWYMTNCIPEAVEWMKNYPEWITCIPIGLSQLNLGFSRFLVSSTLNQRYGNYRRPLTNDDVDNNRIRDAIYAAKHNANNITVMASFAISHKLRISPQQ